MSWKHPQQNSHVASHNGRNTNNPFDISPSSVQLAVPIDIEDDVAKGSCSCECDRFCSHCYFLFACCWFMIASSLARIFTLIDVGTHTVLYVFFHPDSSFIAEIKEDFNDFKYRSSTLDLFMLAIGRSILLYFLYAYKYQLHFRMKVITLIVMICSVLYCIVKLSLHDGRAALGMGIYSLLFSIVEWCVYILVCRKRVIVDRKEQQLEDDLDLEAGLHGTQSSYVAPYESYQQRDRQFVGNALSPSQLNDPTSIHSLGSTFPETAYPTNGAAGPRELIARHATATELTMDGAGPSTRRGFSTMGSRRHASTQHARIGKVSTQQGLRQQQQQQQQQQQASLARAGSLSPQTTVSRLGDGVAAAGSGFSPTTTSPITSTLDGVNDTLLDHPTTQTTTPSTLPVPFDSTTEEKGGGGGDIAVAELTPLHHHSVNYNISLPPEIIRLAQPQSRFLQFEDIRIHYKIVVNPKYAQFYADNLEKATIGKVNGDAPAESSPHTASSSSSPSSSSTPTSEQSVPPCLIVIPGFGSSVYNFDQMTSLMRDYSAVIVFDRPGFGLSDMLTKQHVQEREFLVATQRRDHGHSTLHREIEKMKSYLAESGIDGLANAYDYYSLLQQQCSSVNPYHPHYIVRLVFIFIHIFQLSSIGCVLFGHHSGGTLAVRVTLELDQLFQRVNYNIKQCKTQSTTTSDKTAAVIPSKSLALSSNGSNTLTHVLSPVISIILTAASLFDDGFPPMVRTLFSSKLGKTMIRQLLKTEISEVALRHAFYNPSAISPRLIRLQKVFSRVPLRDEAIAYMASSDHEEHHTSPAGHDQDYRGMVNEWLSKIECPVLLIHGENDKIVPISSSSRIAKALSFCPSIQFVRIPFCGHLPFEEQPDNVAVAVDSFLVSMMRLRKHQVNANSQTK